MRNVCKKVRKNHCMMVFWSFAVLFSPLCFAKEYLITEEKQPQAVSMKVGDTLEFVLEENPSTGYGWEIDTPVQQWLVLCDKTFQKKSDLIGSGGICSLRFVAVSSGKCILTLLYRRSFEKKDLAVKKISIFVDIE